jgi:hypothetical protein
MFDSIIEREITDLSHGIRSERFRENGNDYSLRETSLDFWVLQKYNNRQAHTIAYINHYGDLFQSSYADI